MTQPNNSQRLWMYEQMLTSRYMEESIEQERIALDIRYAQLMEPVSRTPKLTVIDGGKSAGDDHAED